MFNRKAIIPYQTIIIVIRLHAEYKLHNRFKTETCRPRLIFGNGNNKGRYIHISFAADCLMRKQKGLH